MIDCQAYKIVRKKLKSSLLVNNNQTSHTGTSKRAQSASDQSRNGDARNITASAWRNLGEHTDLVAQRSDIGKSTQRIRNNQARARGEAGVSRVRDESLVSDELVLGLLNQLYSTRSGEGVIDLPR